MPSKRRWDPCVGHRGPEVDDFIEEYFAQGDRKALFIAGAGFDPRAAAVCKLLAPILGKQLYGFLLREERPAPGRDLQEKAESSLSLMTELLSGYDIVPIAILEKDNAVVGGRNVVDFIHQKIPANLTDIIVDISALSIGISYPTVRYLIERIRREKSGTNLHLFVTPDPILDESIVPIAGDKIGYVHGFKGGASLATKKDAARLWLPQLALGRRTSLVRIHEFVNPHDTCPILPFPSVRPRLGDELVEHYLTELGSTWSVDPRNVLYAAEDDPLDLYRTILRIDDLRERVFRETGGSLLILSPMGSKVLALGALMAALERDLPVVYLESMGYKVPEIPQDEAAQNTTDPIHVWLEGEVYPREADEEGGRT